MRRILLFSTILLLMACSKNKPRPGIYIGTFEGTYTNAGTTANLKRVEELYIDQSNMEGIIISSCTHCLNKTTLDRKGKTITGILDVYQSEGIDPEYVSDPITIDGKVAKVDGLYRISGTYEYDYHIVSPSDGTDIIKKVTGNFTIIKK